MRLLSRMDIMVKLKEKIMAAKQSRDQELVSRLETLLEDVMHKQSDIAI